MSASEGDGAQVLVVEDEMLVAMLLEEMLADLGCTVVATAARVAEAKAAIEANRLDLAILDMNLNGERTQGLADALAARGIPFIFATGYGARDLEPPHHNRPLITKPFQEEELSAAVAKALGRACVGR